MFKCKRRALFLGVAFVLANSSIVVLANEAKSIKIGMEQQSTIVENSILIPESKANARIKHSMKGTVLGDGVRLRSEPSDTADVLELMYDGERVWVDEDYTGEYERIERISTGRVGYVHASFIQRDFERNIE